MKPFNSCRTVALLLISTMAIISPVLAQKYTPPQSGRSISSLNGAWKFNKGNVTGAQAAAFNDAAWQNVTVPHCWEPLTGQDGGNNYYRGTCWYRRHCTIPSSLLGKDLYLEFNGVNRVADVYLNGTLVGTHKGGYARFRFPVTAIAKVGLDNVVAVKVSNANNADIPPLSGDFTFFGGIYRDVNLLATDNVQISPVDYASSGVYVRQSNVSAASADIQITAKSLNTTAASKDISMRFVITAADSTIVRDSTVTQTIPANTGSNIVHRFSLANPHLWNGLADPYLYRVYVELKVGTTVHDLIEEPLGIRYFRLDANNGFFFNGTYLDLHGVNMHQDFKDLGYAITPKHTDTSLALVHDLGSTFLRLAHYQHSKYTYSYCDSSGMIVWAELALVNHITESTEFYENAKQQLIELIRQNFNHPSILFWSIYNEIDNTSSLISELSALAQQEDSSRISTAASFRGDAYSANWSPQSIAFNKYYGWYSGSFTDFGKWADNIHKAYPSKFIGISEFGAGGNLYHHEIPPQQPVTRGPWHPEEYQNEFNESNWLQMKSRPFIWCKLVWNMFDFASDGRNESNMPGMNDKGLVTYDRKVKKDSYFWFKANWSDDPFVHITSRRFTPRDTTPVQIKVYSNCASVELFVNGTSLGSKTSIDRRFVWDGVAIPLKFNTVRAVGVSGALRPADTVTIGYFGCPDQTLSQGKAASASSTQIGIAAASAVDGNSATSWTAADSTWPQWWKVDLGASREIGIVRIKWYAGSDHLQYRYRIEVSDQENSGFVTASDRTNNMVSGVTEDLLQKVGRYMRVTITGVVPAGMASISEVKVYGPDPVSTTIKNVAVRASAVEVVICGRQVRIQIPQSGPYSLRFIDLSGRIVMQRIGTGPACLTIARPKLPGTCFLQVESEKTRFSRKLALY